MVTYDNEFKTKGSKIQTEDRIEPQHIRHLELHKCDEGQKDLPVSCYQIVLDLSERERKKVILINFDPNDRAQSCFCLSSHGLGNITNSLLKAWIEL